MIRFYVEPNKDGGIRKIYGRVAVKQKLWRRILDAQVSPFAIQRRASLTAEHIGGDSIVGETVFHLDSFSAVNDNHIGHGLRCRKCGDGEKHGGDGEISLRTP